MIDTRTSLTILHDDNGSFTEYTRKMATFGRDSITVTVDSTEDYLYVGFYKPINMFYIDLPEISGLEGSIETMFYNGTNWENVANLVDDTFGFHRSGFVRWDLDEDDSSAIIAVNSIERYWYRIRTSEIRTNIEISGINIVFSDDYELSLEQPYISESEFLSDLPSHIKTHFAVKREIIQKFRNKNYIKYNVDGEKSDITCWDLHDIEEVRQAATYLALSKIYFQLSDNEEDIWNSKSKKYEDKFNKYINIARLSLDINDDGIVSEDENKTSFRTNHFYR